MVWVVNGIEPTILPEYTMAGSAKGMPSCPCLLSYFSIIFSVC